MAAMTNAASLPETIAKAIGQGRKRGDIVKTLTNSGIHPQAASDMVDAAVRNYPSAVRSGAISQIGTGLLLFAIGLVITVGTLAAAHGGATGGFFIVSWGPMVFGAIRVLRGLLRLATA